jgi:hypothetical protein
MSYRQPPLTMKVHNPNPTTDYNPKANPSIIPVDTPVTPKPPPDRPPNGPESVFLRIDELKEKEPPEELLINSLRFRVGVRIRIRVRVRAISYAGY